MEHRKSKRRVITQKEIDNIQIDPGRAGSKPPKSKQTAPEAVVSSNKTIKAYLQLRDWLPPPQEREELSNTLEETRLYEVVGTLLNKAPSLLEPWLQTCHGAVKQSFVRLLAAFSHRMADTKEQKGREALNRKGNSIKSDQNVFQLHKSKAYNMILKEELKKYEQQIDPTLSQNQEQVLMELANRVNRQASLISTEEFQENFVSEIAREREEEKRQIQRRRLMLQNSMLSMLSNIEDLAICKQGRERIVHQREVVEIHQSEINSIREWGLDLVLFRPDLILASNPEQA